MQQAEKSSLMLNILVVKTNCVQQSYLSRETSAQMQEKLLRKTRARNTWLYVYIQSIGE